MKGLVLRKKPFRKPVPAIAQFIDFVGANGVHIRKRNQLYAGRSNCVEAGKLPPEAVRASGKDCVLSPKK